jgi:hypothetical protein
MRDFNFEGVEEASSDSYTQPGTIAVFTIGDVKFETSDNAKDFMELKMIESPGVFFTHRFYMTEKAFPRVQSLHKAIVGNKIEGNITDAQLTAILKDKQVALKVTGRVHNGKVYADLPFGGFCKPVAALAELAYTAKEQIELDAGLAMVRNAATAAPDGEGNAAPATATGTVDDF